MAPPWIRLYAVPAAIAACTSASSGDVRPCSAIAWMPSLAVRPAFQKRTRLECVPPIRREKWGLDGKSAGWVSSRHVDSKVTL
jgi:hypothetical protein